MLTAICIGLVEQRETKGRKKIQDEKLLSTVEFEITSIQTSWVVLEINVAITIFQSYCDFEIGYGLCLISEIKVATPGFEPLTLDQAKSLKTPKPPLLLPIGSLIR